jgi:dTMP kinase
VYQGAARKLDRETIEHLNVFAVGDCVPEITFVLDVDAATAESRMQREPRKADRMEQQPAEFYERVREGYRELAASEPKRIVMVDGSRDVDEMEKQIWETLCSRFPVLTKISNP